AVLVLPLGGCAKLYDVHVGGASVSYWAPELSGDFSDDITGLLGTEIDAEDTLDLGDERIPEFRAFVSAGPLTVEGTYFTANYEGSNTLSIPIQFDGEELTGDLFSEVDLDYAVGKLKLGLIGAGPVAVGAILGVGYIRLAGELTGESTGIIPLTMTVDDEIDTPFPVVGATVTLDQGITEALSIFGEAEAFGIAINDQFDLDGHFVDAQARAGIGIADIFRIGVGYRVMDLNVEETNDQATWNLRLQGPYLFGELRF
ncbi:MAG: hypothetical protein KDC38_18535, partial [Planctomycetes bacterium]|nr:hypothetical protein [Planctomycetota bacterium]